jgi:transcriptional regulator with XRE-family HTH domain
LQTICLYLVTAKLGIFPSMEHTSEQQRTAFSKRLTQELKRIGQPISSPTQIARAFNKNFSGQPVTAQTVRKWLLSEGMPTQPKLLTLAAWLGVSAQWLRYGSGVKFDATAPLSAQQTGLLVLGKEYAGLAQSADIIPLLDKLVRLSPRDIRIVEGMVQLMYSESSKK